MAADLRGDLLGTTADLTPSQVRWLSPAPLWAGILAGPVAWALDETISYALVQPSCARGSRTMLELMTLAALVVIAGGAVVSWTSFWHAPAGPTDGARDVERARFMAVLGLASSAFFAIATIALDIPRWVLDACR